MKTNHVTVTNENQSAVSLHKLIGQLLDLVPAVAKHQGISLVNNVSAQLRVNAHEETIRDVIRGVLQALLLNTNDTVIYISAKEWFGTMMEVNVRDENCFNTYGVALALQDVVEVAGKIGGKLDITNQKQKITTISFRFSIRQHAQ